MNVARSDNDGDLLGAAIRGCAGGIGFAAFIGLFINILHLAVPLYMMQIFDRVMNSRSHDTLFMLTVLVAAAIVFMATLDFIRARTFIITGEQIALRLQGVVFQAAISDSLRTQSPGAMQATRDLQELRQFVTAGPVALPFDALFAPALLGVLFLLHPAYGLVAVIGLGGMLALSLLMEFAARRPSGGANDAAMRAHQDVNTAIRNAEIIEGMGMLDAVFRRWQRSQRLALEMVGNGNNAAKAISAFSRGFRMALQVAVLGTGALLAIDNASSAGSITAATVLMGRFLAPFDQMIDGWRQWTNTASAFTRLRKLLRAHRETRSSTPVDAAAGRLAVERLTFLPPGADRPVLRGVSFTLEPGDVLGIIGPSGAGKSTLARLMVGLWQPTSGRIYLDGQDVYAWERKSFGRQVGYVPQNASLLDGTIRENIARMQDADAAAVISAAKRADVHDMIGRLPLGYETRIGDAGFVLSGGQRQRIALARALFGTPKLLVLDEPNANLDAAGEQSLLHAIAEAKAAGTTVVMVAHRTSIMAAADKLLVLRDGVVEQFGARAEILRDMQSPVVKVVTGGRAAALPVERSLSA